MLFWDSMLKMDEWNSFQPELKKICFFYYYTIDNSNFPQFFNFLHNLNLIKLYSLDFVGWVHYCKGTLGLQISQVFGNWAQHEKPLLYLSHISIWLQRKNDFKISQIIFKIPSLNNHSLKYSSMCFCFPSNFYVYCTFVFINFYIFYLHIFKLFNSLMSVLVDNLWFLSFPSSNLGWLISLNHFLLFIVWEGEGGFLSA